MSETDDASRGTCTACGQELIYWRGDVWHPPICGPCPASTHGRPGAYNFVRAGEGI